MQKCLINVSEELDTKSAKLGTGTCKLKQILVWCLFVPCVFTYQKKLKSHLILINIKSKDLFQASSRIKHGLSLASVLHRCKKLTIHVLIIANQT